MCDLSALAKKQTLLAGIFIAVETLIFIWYCFAFILDFRCSRFLSINRNVKNHKIEFRSDWKNFELRTDESNFIFFPLKRQFHPNRKQAFQRQSTKKCFEKGEVDERKFVCPLRHFNQDDTTYNEECSFSIELCSHYLTNKNRRVFPI